MDRVALTLGEPNDPVPKAGDETRTVGPWRLSRIDGAVSLWIPFGIVNVPANATPAQFVAAQLRASVPRGEWNHGNVDRAQELATMLYERRGVRDVSKLALLRVTMSREIADSILVREVDDENAPLVPRVTTRAESRQGFALSYDGGAPWGFLHAQDAPRDYWIGETELEQAGGLNVAVSYVGKGGIRYQIAPTEYGFAIAPDWFSTSDADKIRGILRTFAGVAVSFILPAAGINLAASIGNTLLGSLAVQYPALASALGRVVLSSAISGTDLKDGIRGAALSLVGGQAGSLIASTVNDATRLELLSKVAGAAANAAIQGGDPRRAAGMTLLQNGIASMDNIFSSDNTVQPTFTDFDRVVDNAALPSDLPAVQYLPPPMPTLDVPTVTIADQVAPSVSPATTTPPVAASPGIDWRGLQNIVNFASSAAITVARTVQAVRAAGNPPLVTAAQVTTPAGQRATMLDDGFIRQTGADGRQTMTRPTVGVPHSTVTGNIAINNGDGSYILIRPDGSSTVNRYGRYDSAGTDGGSLSSGSVFGNIPPALLIGGGVLILALATSAKGSR